MPRKVFVAGEVLTAADVNTNLMDQAVMTFAGTAARGSAIGTAVEGMVTYLEDDNSLQFYDGSSWLPVVSPSTGNAIINGDFGVNQRGFSSTTSSGEFLFDRFRNNFSGGTSTYSAQTFSEGDLEVIGYGDAASYLRIANSSYTGTSAYCLLQQYVEDVRTFAGQTVTFSFWAKSGSSSSITIEFEQEFGAGGSSNVTNIGSVKIATTTSWARYSAIIAVPSVAGKTIVKGNDSLRVNMWFEAGTDFNTRSNSLGIQNDTFDLWGVQLEAGPVATPFKLAGGGSKAAELALCQRYYLRFGGSAPFERIANGEAGNTTTYRAVVHHPVSLRTEATDIDYSTLGIFDGVNLLSVSSASIDTGGQLTTSILATVSGATAFRPYTLIVNNSLAGHLGLGAEL